VASDRKLGTASPASRPKGAARLRREIAALALTQEQAGALVGVTDRQVRKWLKPRKRPDRLDLLCALEEASRASGVVPRVAPALKPARGHSVDAPADTEARETEGRKAA